MSHAPRPSRAPHRQLRVTCHAGSRLAVGRRPAAEDALARPPALPVPALPVVEAQAWSRGLWGTFLPDRRKHGAEALEGRPERRRDAA